MNINICQIIYSINQYNFFLTISLGFLPLSIPLSIIVSVISLLGRKFYVACSEKSNLILSIFNVLNINQIRSCTHNSKKTEKPRGY